MFLEDFFAADWQKKNYFSFYFFKSFNVQSIPVSYKKLWNEIKYFIFIVNKKLCNIQRTHTHKYQWIIFPASSGITKVWQFIIFFSFHFVFCRTNKRHIFKARARDYPHSSILWNMRRTKQNKNKSGIIETVRHSEMYKKDKNAWQFVQNLWSFTISIEKPWIRYCT